jgi:NADPH:quinone reductase-like Zn-dependent oxidoreductase
MLMQTGARPVVDSSFVLGRAADAYARLASGDAFGKVVLRAAA